MEVNTRVSPSLHPSNVSALAGYNDETASSVADVLGAFGTAYESLTDVHLARQAASQNPELTEAAQILVVADFADKHFKKITRSFDAAHARVKAAIADGEQQLSQPLKSAAAGGFSVEIRAHVKSMKLAERVEFMNEAIRAGDMDTLASVLGAPSYLSGLSPVERDMFTRNYREQTNPMLAQRLALMKAAQTLIHERGGMVFEEIDKAIGASPAQVAKLKAAREKAEKAYTFKS